jgi:hypothetical protein
MNQNHEYFKKEIMMQGSSTGIVESEFLEFKSINQKRIAETAIEYIVGFLNSSTNLGSDLYATICFGVSDKGVIDGVEIKPQEKDEIHRKIYERLRKIHPEVPTSIVSEEIKFREVLDGSKEIIQGSYVIVIQLYIQSHDRKFPYKTTKNGSIYQRQGTSNPKLNNSKVIQKEINNRTRSEVSIKLRQIHLEIQDQIKKTGKPDIGKVRQQLFLGQSLKDTDAIHSAYENMTKFYPKDTRILEDYLKVQEKLQNYDLALEICQELANKQDNSKFRENFDLRKAEILKKLKRYPDAQTEYENVLKNNPDDYVTVTKLAIILRELKHYDESISLLQGALQINPKYRTASYELRKTYREMFSL